MYCRSSKNQGWKVLNFPYSIVLLPLILLLDDIFPKLYSLFNWLNFYSLGRNASLRKDIFNTNPHNDDQEPHSDCNCCDHSTYIIDCSKHGHVCLDSCVHDSFVTYTECNSNSIYSSLFTRYYISHNEICISLQLHLIYVASMLAHCSRNYAAKT